MFEIGDGDLFDPDEYTPDGVLYETFDDLKKGIAENGSVLIHRDHVFVAIYAGKCRYCPTDHLFAYRRDGLLTRAYNIDESRYDGDPQKLFNALFAGAVLDSSLEEQILEWRYAELLPEELYFNSQNPVEVRRREYTRHAFYLYLQMRQQIACFPKENEIRDIVYRIATTAYSLGRVFSEGVAQEDLEPAAFSFYEQETEKQKNRAKGADRTQQKAQEQRASCLALVELVAKENPVAFALAATHKKAELTRNFAKQNRRSEFEFRKGKLLSTKWFTERLEDFHASGELQEIVERLTKKA